MFYDQPGCCTHCLFVPTKKLTLKLLGLKKPSLYRSEVNYVRILSFAFILCIYVNVSVGVLLNEFCTAKINNP